MLLLCLFLIRCETFPQRKAVSSFTMLYCNVGFGGRSSPMNVLNDAYTSLITKTSQKSHFYPLYNRYEAQTCIALENTMSCAEQPIFPKTEGITQNRKRRIDYGYQRTCVCSGTCNEDFQHCYTLICHCTCDHLPYPKRTGLEGNSVYHERLYGQEMKHLITDPLQYISRLPLFSPRLEVGFQRTLTNAS